jgi:transposase
VIEHDGEQLSIRAWAKRLGIHEATIRSRLRAGKPTHEALGLPVPDPETLTYKGTTKTLAEWEAETGIDRCTLRSRIKAGWKPGRALYQPARQHTR